MLNEIWPDLKKHSHVDLENDFKDVPESNAALQEAQETFGVDFDYDEFYKYEQEDYNEGEYDGQDNEYEKDEIEERRKGAKYFEKVFVGELHRVDDITSYLYEKLELVGSKLNMNNISQQIKTTYQLSGRDVKGTAESNCFLKIRKNEKNEACRRPEE
ncbi:hypothetical protein WA026_012503 [Henosepilachna vigintioctopunctata]|uniref:Uncharacterized protein n=1 Tax=Henosepilachna vigintioctopunctata TaxID=420089 RepID=A0AAW1V1K2_9CUCU